MNAPQTAVRSDPAPLAVSTAAWDGHELPEILASMGRLDITDVEIAFIRGYVNDFSDDDLNPEAAREIRAEMTRHGQRCRVLSAHIDLGQPNALESFAIRVRFAAELGANYLITNAASRRGQDAFFERLDEMTAMIRDAQIRVCLENPGDGRDNMINRAADLADLLPRVDRSVFGVNYDPGNLISHCPALSPTDDALCAIAYCDHLHLKAVQRVDDGYAFVPMGSGDINYRPILAAIAERRLPLSLELPFRLRRDRHAQPWKLAQCLPLDEIEHGVANSLQWVRDTQATL